MLSTGFTDKDGNTYISTTSKNGTNLSAPQIQIKHLGNNYGYDDVNLTIASGNTDSDTNNKVSISGGTITIGHLGNSYNGTPKNKNEYKNTKKNTLNLKGDVITINRIGTEVTIVNDNEITSKLLEAIEKNNFDEFKRLVNGKEVKFNYEQIFTHLYNASDKPKFFEYFVKSLKLDKNSVTKLVQKIFNDSSIWMHKENAIILLSRTDVPITATFFEKSGEEVLKYLCEKRPDEIKKILKEGKVLHNIKYEDFIFRSFNKDLIDFQIENGLLKTNLNELVGDSKNNGVIKYLDQNYIFNFDTYNIGKMAQANNVDLLVFALGKKTFFEKFDADIASCVMHGFMNCEKFRYGDNKDATRIIEHILNNPEYLKEDLDALLDLALKNNDNLMIEKLIKNGDYCEEIFCGVFDLKDKSLMKKVINNYKGKMTNKILGYAISAGNLDGAILVCLKDKFELTDDNVICAIERDVFEKSGFKFFNFLDTQGAPITEKVIQHISNIKNYKIVESMHDQLVDLVFDLYVRVKPESGLRENIRSLFKKQKIT